MDNGFIKLGIAALLPVLLCVVLYTLEKKTSFGKVKRMRRQVIIGTAFGVLAIVGTEWGIPMNGAQVNCRDAAVLTAGLMFGAPAGIIAGVLGGVERWIAVYWGIGSYTRVACSVSTVIAGFYAGALRKYLFEDKTPSCVLSLATGIVMEVFHLTMVFITNMGTTEKAMTVVKACTIPMVIANGLSVFLASLMLGLLFGHVFKRREKSQVRISQTIQRYLLITVVCAFIVTSFFVYQLQNALADEQIDTLLNLALEDTINDVIDTTDEDLIELTNVVSAVAFEGDLDDIAHRYDLAEINMVNKKGIITDSTEPDFIGFDFDSGEQSREFLCLLEGTKEYAQAYGPISYDDSIMRKYVGVATDYGFIQVGFTAEQMVRDIGSTVVGITTNRHVGSTGIVLILDKELELISGPEDFDIDTLKWTEGSEHEAGEIFTLTIDGANCYAAMNATESYCIVAIQPEEEALQMRNVALYVNTFMEILVFAVLFGLIYLLIRKVVVDRIKSVNESLDRITGGDLNEVVNVRGNEEFASLSDDINSTVDTLKRFIDEASARIDAELEFAKNIQASALPNVFPAFPKRKDFDIFASMNPAKEVGGDFYDFYMTGSDDLHFLIADVSGKGIPAAMFMMRAKTELKSLTETGMKIDEVFTRGNAALCEGNDAGMFVTAWQGGINLETGLVRFANAGHNPPLVRRGGGQFEYLRSKVGFVLAGMDGVKYKVQEIQLEPGDEIYLYTDGVTEATNAETELYGEDRLLAAINAKEFESMEDLCHYVKNDVDNFVGEAPQFDDITMVALHFKGQPPVPTFHVDECSLEDIPVLTAFVEEELEKLGAPMKTTVQMSVAIDEIYSNIVYYAYEKDAKGPATVKVIHDEEKNVVNLCFMDEGIPYNPLVKEDPDITLSAEERGIGGLGIYMVKKTMDIVQYRYENEQNILTIGKKL